MSDHSADARIIWITGASSGIGRATALKLAGLGERVMASSRRAAELDSLADEADALPGSIHAYPLDVTDVGAVHAIRDRILEEHGIPDVVLLNAGVGVPTPASRADPEPFRKTMDINYQGTVNCIMAVLEPMIARGSGVISVVASVAGYRGLPNSGAYCASKAALISLCESLHPELKPLGIAVKVVCPGFIRTPMTDKNRYPMPFLMEVDEAGDRIVTSLAADRFETTFPRRFTWMLKILQRTPNAVYLRLMNILARGAGKAAGE